MITLKRTVSLFLSLALAAGMLAGCSGGEGASSGGGSASSAPPDGSAAQEIEPMDLSAVTDPYLATAGLAGDTVVASAGQYDITAGSLLYWLNSAMDNYVSQISALGMTSIPWDAEVDGETIEDALLQSALEAAAFYRLLPELGAVLVIGLGNRRITADSLGPRVVDGVLVTRHMRENTPASLKGRLRAVSAVAPGVLGVTGMETAEVVRGIVEHTRPEAVIAVDALAARETARICTTMQIADTGIQPGSGVGNHRLGLNEESLGVPVIAVGVPMVVYAATIARDALELLMEDLAPDGEEHAGALDALVDRVVARRLGDLVVTPREVDERVTRMADLLALGINRALQPRLDKDEIPALMH